jgi:hypothetical protein
VCVRVCVCVCVCVRMCVYVYACAYEQEKGLTVVVGSHLAALARKHPPAF